MPGGILRSLKRSALFTWFWACPHPSKHGCVSGWMNTSNMLKNGNKDLSATEVVLIWRRIGYSLSVRQEEESKMGIIGWIVFGLIVGAVAKLLMPGRDPGGWIVTIVLGIAGALVGGFLGRALGWYGPNDAAGFLMALVGALVLLGLYRLTLGRST